MKQKNWYLRLGAVLTALSFAYILLGIGIYRWLRPLYHAVK